MFPIEAASAPCDASLAVRLRSFACLSSVLNQCRVKSECQIFWHYGLQRPMSLRFADLLVDESQSPRYTEDVCVDRNCRHSEAEAKNDCGCLRSDARKREQPLSRILHFHLSQWFECVFAKPIFDFFQHRDNALCLLIRESRLSNYISELLLLK